jgi:hypothetical protein
VRAGAHDDAAAPRAVGLPDAGAADDDAAGREVGALDVLSERVDRGARVVDQRDDRVGDLAQPVGRDVRRHADGDAGGAVDEQVREPRGEHGRLAARLVVVRDEVDRVHVDVPEHLRGDPGEPALRVAHRRGRVVVDGAEVPLAVDQGVAQRKRLRHPHERVVDRRVAVRVVRAHDVADHASGLLVGPVRLHPGVVHAVEDASVHGLEAVAYVGERAADDDRHRVVEEARAHLLLEHPVLDAAGAERARLDLRHGSPPSPRVRRCVRARRERKDAESVRS